VSDRASICVNSRCPYFGDSYSSSLPEDRDRDPGCPGCGGVAGPVIEVAERVPLSLDHGALGPVGKLDAAGRAYVRALRAVRRWVHEGGAGELRQLEALLEHAKADLYVAAEAVWMPAIEVEEN
jgi:hypothetical protein